MKSMIKNIASVVILFLGALFYSFSRKNKEIVYQALVRSFCFSRGISNDVLSSFISFWQRSKRAREGKDEFVEKIVGELSKKGYYVLEDFFDVSVIDKLINITEIYHCSSKKKLDSNILCSYHKIVNEKDLSGINGTRLDYNESELVKNKDIQNVILNPFFLDVARKYLQAQPIVDITAMWWTIAGKKVDLIEDAQMFHFDMDRIKWLKVFVYLTDVEEENGPHVFIEGSHQTNGIPRLFLKRGYQRIEDTDVFNYYGIEKAKTFCGKKGTIIFEDTRGLHKGMPIQSGGRLVFQVEYTNSLFGASIDKKIKDSHLSDQKQKDVLAAYY